MPTIHPLLRLLALATLSLLSACTPQLLAFLVPLQVRPGAVFEVAVFGDTQGDSIAFGDVGCVVQIPNGFTLLGCRNDLLGGSTRAPQINLPQLLGSFTAEPGHYLASFEGNSAYPDGVRGRVALKLYLQAPAGGAAQHTLKVVLAARTAAVWNAIEPAGVTQFAAITAAPYSRVLDLVPGAATDFDVDRDSIAFGSALTFLDSLSGPRDVSFDDVDQDGDSDFVAFDSGLQVWRSTPGQSWSLAASGLGMGGLAFGVAFGDFDGDGARDLVMADGSTRFGNGGTAWTTGPTLAVASGGSLVAAGDVDRDGRDDVLLTGPGGAMRLHRGLANRTFALANNGLPMSGSGTLAGVWLVDLTGDGNLDVYAAITSTPNVWIGDGAGNWTPGSGLPPQQRQATFGDLDGNGTAELVLFGAIGDPTTLGVLVYRHLGGGTFGPWLSSGLPTTAMRSAAAVLDVDGDGRQEVVIGTRVNNSAPQPVVSSGLEVWQNLGGGAFQLRQQTGLSSLGNVTRLVQGDFDGNRVPDLAVQFHPWSKTLFYRGMRQPPFVRVPHGCSGQTLQATGSGTIGSTVNVTVGNSTGIPLLGLGLAIASTPLCSNCVLGHDWAVTVGGSSSVLPIPPAPSLVGVQVGMQGADVLAASGCLGLPIAFSDTLVFTIR